MVRCRQGDEMDSCDGPGRMELLVSRVSPGASCMEWVDCNGRLGGIVKTGNSIPADNPGKAIS